MRASPPIQCVMWCLFVRGGVLPYVKTEAGDGCQVSSSLSLYLMF